MIGGSQARRLVWILASTMDSVRGAITFEHADTSYRRFVARTLLAALAIQGPSTRS